MNIHRYRGSGEWLILITTLLSMTAPSVSAQTTIIELGENTHFHGIAVDASDSSRIYLATHHGLFVVSLDGSANRISNNRNDYMGFTPHPSNETVLYASGHPSGGGNMGFIRSEDGGRTWKQLSQGVNGPVDFHQLDVSKADPTTIYGVFRNIQVSIDGGHTWSVRAPPPPDIIDLTATATSVDQLFAATKGGLLFSNDGGRTWSPAHTNQSPATMVQATVDGSVYAFVVGLGLIRSAEDTIGWTSVSNEFGNRYLLHLAADPANTENLYVITNKAELLATSNGGDTWRRL